MPILNILHKPAADAVQSFPDAAVCQCKCGVQHSFAVSNTSSTEITQTGRISLLYLALMLIDSTFNWGSEGFCGPCWEFIKASYSCFTCKYLKKIIYSVHWLRIGWRQVWNFVILAMSILAFVYHIAIV